MILYTYGSLLLLDGTIPYGGYEVPVNNKKLPITWLQNPLNVNPYVYDQPFAQYDSIYPIYDGVLSQPLNTKKRDTFTKVSKNSGNWRNNPAGDANLRPYDQSADYDRATINYDGITPNQPVESTKKRTTWTPN